MLILFNILKVILISWLFILKLFSESSIRYLVIGIGILSMLRLTILLWNDNNLTY